ncbi:hypothetical protein BABINDRAFT_6756 [Babjeviella inositovora NRRL Y-12698]|uniref:Amino acid permease/ SLC12A domain-containing protein n=1 Tax=Babjeviella inositovora NRRL Y-12698 TaxID=984486 RepID=A0A1E3QX30_9ASCO|nr:uncharacterized protein BABINDRAFT_6756 [Babjeviella inositovora NRRL Y-12698]ODQ82151.1 hypothetical protein BABINDRAFT_6756 [Babjeviella inositovora NRRL Y-12698]
MLLNLTYKFNRFFVINDFVEFSLTLGILPVSFLALLQIDNTLWVTQALTLKRARQERLRKSLGMSRPMDDDDEDNFSPFPQEEEFSSSDWFEPGAMCEFKKLTNKVLQDRLMIRSFALFHSLVDVDGIPFASIEYYRSFGSAHIIDYLTHSKTDLFDEASPVSFDLVKYEMDDLVMKKRVMRDDGGGVYPRFCPTLEEGNQLLSDAMLIAIDKATRSQHLTIQDITGLLDRAVREVHLYAAAHTPFVKVVPNASDRLYALTNFQEELTPEDCPITLYQNIYGETPWAWVRWYEREPRMSPQNEPNDSEKINSAENSHDYFTDLDPVLSKRTAEYNMESIRSNVVPIPEDRKLKRDLKARHMIMIAIGGAVGPGLLIGSGSTLYHSGPGSAVIAYAFVGILVYAVMAAMGEMATYIPLPGGFAEYSARYADPALGFATGWTYLFSYLISTPNQLTSAALVMQYWVPREKLNPGVWIVIFMIIIWTINAIGVKWFGEIEFWLSALKIITILGLIILLIVITAGGGPTHETLGFKYWKHPGAFRPMIGTTGAAGKVAAWVSVLVNALFAFIGIEFVVVTSSECTTPRKTIPKAIKLTFYRILFFYVASMFLLGCTVAYNDPGLEAALDATAGASASPFVLAIVNAKIPYLPHILNACILIFALSSANSDFYVCTRTLYGLAYKNQAPRFFSKTNKQGVPIYSFMFCAAFMCIAFMNVSSASMTVFSYFVNVVGIFGLLVWISMLYTHICFMRALKAQGISRDSLVWKAPFAPFFTYFALFFCILVALIKNFDVFVGKFDYKNFITGYIGIPVYLICIVGYKLIMKPARVKAAEADLFTYKDVVDKEEGDFLALQAKKREEFGLSRGQWFYETFLAWCF